MLFLRLLNHGPIKQKLPQSFKLQEFGLYYLSLSYSSSVTGSSHSLEVSSPGTSKARWANQPSEAAPCHCFTFAGIWITVPCRISTAGFPSSCYHPRPATPLIICPPPLVARCMCQLLRQRGSKVTLETETCSRETGAR